VILRTRRLDVQRALGRRHRVAPVSPAPLPAPALPGEVEHAPAEPSPAPRGLLAEADGRGVGLLSTRVDEPTTLLRTVPTRSVDLWDTALHVAQAKPRRSAITMLGRWLHVVAPAALTSIVCAIGLGRPALWTDELATWGMATTPWSEFWPVLRYVDAVLAPYYIFMRVWVDVFGDSDVSLRMPSMLAMVAAAGLVGAIGNRLAGRSAGIVAGAVFGTLASTSRFAAEARPYAFTVLAACAATWLLLRAWDRPSAARWAGYGAAVAVLGSLHLVALLLVAGHAWALLAFRRGLWRGFSLAAASGLVPSLAFVAYGLQQRGQVAYIKPISVETFDEYNLVLFGGLGVLAVLVVAGLFGLPLRYPSAVFTAWAVVPVVALAAVSVVLPMFLPRYLLYTTPGWALLAGVALTRLRPVWLVATMLLLVGLAGPAHVQMRDQSGHGQDTRELALLVGAGAQRGDGIVYADHEWVGSWTARDAIAHYLPAAYRPQDVLATSAQRTGGQLEARECLDISACVGERRRLWVVRAATLDDPLSGLGASKEDFLRGRYEVVQVWHPAGLTVALIERTSTAS
jgi:mannosyltransferase